MLASEKHFEFASAPLVGVEFHRSLRRRRGYGAVGSALPWHGRGHGFESR